MGRGVRVSVQAQLYATLQPHTPFTEGQQVSQSARHSPPPQHLPTLRLLGSHHSYQLLPPSFPRKHPAAGLYLATGSEINFKQRQHVPPAGRHLAGLSPPVPLQPGFVSVGRGRHKWLPDGYWPF